VWNKEVFGNIFAKKKKLMNLLLGIQTTLARCPSQSLIFLQENLLEELNQILNLEEDL
jgi:hypothetical protein